MFGHFVQLTWWGHHPLPFLEQAGLEAVAGTETVGLMPGHEFLHGLQDHTQLVEEKETRSFVTNIANHTTADQTSTFSFYTAQTPLPHEQLQ